MRHFSCDGKVPGFDVKSRGKRHTLTHMWKEEPTYFLASKRNAAKKERVKKLFPLHRKFIRGQSLLFVRSNNENCKDISFPFFPPAAKLDVTRFDDVVLGGHFHV